MCVRRPESAKLTLQAVECGPDETMKGDADGGEEAPPGLALGQWKVHPPTGIVSLTDQAFAALLNPQPIESLYILDPEPIAR